MTANWSNRSLYIADNLDVMRGMNSESVDLIYLDPPFNAKRVFSGSKQYSADELAAMSNFLIDNDLLLDNELDQILPTDKDTTEASFNDIWRLKAPSDEASDEDKAFHERMIEDMETLAASNSTFYQKIMAANSESEKVYLSFMLPRLLEMRRILKPTGSLYLHCDPTMSHYLKVLLDGIFSAQNFRNEIVWCYHSGGASRKHFARKHDILLLYGGGGNITHNIIRTPYRDFYAEKDTTGRYHPEGKMISDWWEISQVSSVSRERTGWPTQKPLALLERIIKASSNESDVIFDPFCGCATTCVAAEKLGRQWLGCDISPLAAWMVYDRLRADTTTPTPRFYKRYTVPTRTDDGAIVDMQSLSSTQGVLGFVGSAASRESKAAVDSYASHKSALYLEQDGTCHLCERAFPLSIMEVDHIVPRSRGGSDEKSNLQILCAACNRRKATKTMDEMLKGRTLREYRRQVQLGLLKS